MKLLLPWFLNFLLMPMFMSIVKGEGGDAPAGDDSQGGDQSPDAGGSSGDAGAAVNVEQYLSSLEKIPETDRGSVYQKLLDKLEPSAMSSGEYRSYLASLQPEQRAAQRMSFAKEISTRLKKVQASAPGDFAAKEAEYKNQLGTHARTIEELKAQLQKNAPEIQLPDGFEKYDENTQAMAKQLLGSISQNLLKPMQEEISRLKQPFEEDAQRQELAKIVEAKNQLAPFLPDSMIQTMAILNSSLPEGKRMEIPQLTEEALVQFYDGVSSALEANDPGVMEKVSAWYPKAMEKQNPMALKLTQAVLKFYTANQDKLKNLGGERTPIQLPDGKDKAKGPSNSREARSQIGQEIEKIVASAKAKFGGSEAV